jgi:hypothetical protein
MALEQKQALQEHIQAIAKILYENTSQEKLTNLALIEEEVRSQMQKHIMPLESYQQRANKLLN